jgi:nucleoid DNA-binding protein
VCLEPKRQPVLVLVAQQKNAVLVEVKRRIMTITKYEIVNKIYNQLKPKITRSDILKIVQMFIDEISNSVLAGNRVELRDFGVFSTKLRKPKLGRNPKTNQPVPIPPRLVITFKPGRNLKAKLTKTKPV